MQDLLSQIQTKLGDIHKTASSLPAGTDVSKASSMLGGMTNQVKSVMSNAMPSVMPVDTAQAPPPPTFKTQQPPDDLSLKAQVDKQRAELEATYRTQLEQINKKMEASQKLEAEMRAKQEGVLRDADPLTSPFRDELEKSERERLKIEENFFANQSLTNELDRLLTESIEMTRKLQTQKVPGLAGLQQSSRMVKAQEGVQSRIAVIEAVMAARNNQIGTATTFIDRSLRNIQQDRQDRLGYLENLFNFYETTKTEEGKKIFNLTQDQKAIIQEQTNLIKTDLARAEAVADKIKDIILSNPTMAHEAGLSLNDTEEEITKKISNWEYNGEVRNIQNQAEEKGLKVLNETEIGGYPSDRVFTQIDSRGIERSFLLPPDQPEYKTQVIDGSLYRFDMNTGQYELMIEGTSPAALAQYKAGLSAELERYKSGLRVTERVTENQIKDELKGIKVFDDKGKKLLLSKGFDQTTINQIESAISKYGFNEAIKDSNLTDSGKKVVKDAMGLQATPKEIVSSVLSGFSQKEIIDIIKKDYKEFIRKEGGIFGIGAKTFANIQAFEKHLTERVESKIKSGQSIDSVRKELLENFTE